MPRGMRDRDGDGDGDDKYFGVGFSHASDEAWRSLSHANANNFQGEGRGGIRLRVPRDGAEPFRLILIVRL